MYGDTGPLEKRPLVIWVTSNGRQAHESVSYLVPAIAYILPFYLVSSFKFLPNYAVPRARFQKIEIKARIVPGDKMRFNGTKVNNNLCVQLFSILRSVRFRLERSEYSYLIVHDVERMFYIQMIGKV